MNYRSPERLEILRGLTPDQRWRIAREINRAARDTLASDVRHLHPLWDEEEVQKAVARWFLISTSSDSERLENRLRKFGRHPLERFLDQHHVN